LRYVGEAACWRFDECASTRAALRDGPAPNFDFDGNGLAERYVAPALRDDGALPAYAAWRLAIETTDRAPCRDCEGHLSTAEVIPFMPSGDPGFALPMRLLPHRDAPALHAIGPGIVEDWLSCFRRAGFDIERVGAGRNPTIELEVRPDMEWRFEDGGWAYDLITCQAKVFTRANTWRCPDEDEDDLDDLCDCEQVDPLPDDDAPLAEKYCHDPDTAPEMGGRPGRWVCRPGTCEPYPSVNAWLEEAVLGDLPGSDAIYEASAIDYVHVDSLAELQGAEPRCPPGEICQAQATQAAKRGHQFEAHVCRRLLARHRGDVECKQHPNPFMRRPKFRTEALQWALPPGSDRRRSPGVERPAKPPRTRPAGRGSRARIAGEPGSGGMRAPDPRRRRRRGAPSAPDRARRRRRARQRHPPSAPTRARRGPTDPRAAPPRSGRGGGRDASVRAAIGCGATASAEGPTRIIRSATAGRRRPLELVDGTGRIRVAPRLAARSHGRRWGRRRSVSARWDRTRPVDESRTSAAGAVACSSPGW